MPATLLSVAGYQAGIIATNNWAVNYYSGGVSWRPTVASITAVLDNNKPYVVSHYPWVGCGTAGLANLYFYSFTYAQIKWDTVLPP
jgi:hypothetical protein